MITQYTRILADPISGEIKHCTSQVSPFKDGWQPAEEYDAAETLVVVDQIDFEIDADYPDADFGIGVNQEMIRARKIIDNFEIVSGQPQLKSSAAVEVSGKVMRVSAVKDIQETAIKSELAGKIRTALIGGGSSEAELLNEMRVTDAATPVTLEALATVKLIRLKKALEA